MNLAAEIAAARPEARILVCVADVRSGLQNQLPGTAAGEHSRAALLSCALFRDAASAVIMGGRYTHAIAHPHLPSAYAVESGLVCPLK